ncbi:MAG TPA: hypothetical protein VK784_11535 [Pseudonocardiaceae bacterium]|jgi:hypothetical protein|nr:hypothetical protein [Pseudonocardiaceae bacterium]
MTSEGQPARARRKAIPATCALHRGPIGFANLMVSVSNGKIVFDPHVTGSCVITLDEAEACVLRDLLTEWLG